MNDDMRIDPTFLQGLTQSHAPYAYQEQMLTAYLKQRSALVEIESMKARAEHADNELAFIAERRKATVIWAAAVVKAVGQLTVGMVASAFLLGWIL